MQATSENKETWKTIFLFLLILSVLSVISYYAILKLRTTSIYVGALMFSPALASFITLKIRRKPLSSLPWNLKDSKYLKLSYTTPILYISFAYAFIWLFGFGNFFSKKPPLETEALIFRLAP